MTAQPERPFHVGVIVSPHPHAAGHLRTLDALPAVEGIHLCAVEGADAGALAGNSPKLRSTTERIDDLLAQPEIDAAIVCVRNDLCPGILEAAVTAGKAALFEKPGALRAADLRRIAALGRDRGVPLGTMFQWRGHPIIHEVRQALGGGALGRVMAVEARMVTSQVRYRDPSHWLFRRDTAGSGILSWLACHYLDLLCFLLGERITEVAALVGQQNPEQIEVEDTACVAFRFQSGILGTLHAGYLLVGSRSGYSGATYDTFIGLRGTDGYVRLPLSEAMSYTLVSEAPGWAAGGRRERSFELPKSPAYGGRAGEFFVLDFLRAARTGGTPPAPIDAAVHVLEIVEAILESSATGRLVTVKDSSEPAPSQP
ncbi:MAG: Gfo/Idh/MocA family oxidoreductase [Chloroflexi bacterium]|nr:Gfo/Idh/MocA family oxidoreductase [Chloroflexota bacterium]